MSTNVNNSANPSKIPPGAQWVRRNGQPPVPPMDHVMQAINGFDHFCSEQLLVNERSAEAIIRLERMLFSVVKLLLAKGTLWEEIAAAMEALDGQENLYQYWGVPEPKEQDAQEQEAASTQESAS